jgi:[ribosomal protein S18]-alanine N-acetyltransferase
MATAPDQLDAAPRLQIRPMVEADVARVIHVERGSYQFPWSEGIFRDCLRVGYFCRVAVLDADLVGYAVMSTGAGEAHVLNLCVRGDCRCRGIGRSLLALLLDRATTLGMHEAYLEVRPSNTNAIRLYQSLGFEQVGMRRGYYQAAGGREDAAVLKLPLRGWRSRRA